MKKLFLLAFTLLVTALSAHAADFPGGGSWSYDFYTKKLTIDAETVPDYSYTTNSYGRVTTAPWSSHATDINEIVFTSQLKTIGKNAFCGIWATRVTFQGTNLITIKENAFYDSHLIHFDFTYVKQIDEWAFCNTTIDYAYLPNIETINGAPFTNCMYMLRDPAYNDGLNFRPSIIIKSGTRDLTINGAIANYTKYAYGKQMVIMADMHHLGTQWPASVQNTVRSYFNKLVFGQRENWGYSENVTGGDIGSYWYIDENNRLIVDYWGYQMPNYTINSAPWWYLGVKAKEVHIYGAAEKAIGEYAFRSFTEITKVVFHGSSSVNDIKKYAFADCPKLSDIRLENINQVRANAFDGCSQLTYADLSNCVYIYQEAFKGCNLSTLYFSDALISISHRGFQNGIADNAHIYITRPTPPTTGDDVFSNVNQSTVTLHLTDAQGDAYNVAPWNAFNRTAVGTKLYGVYNGSMLTIYYDGSMVSRGGYENWNAQTSKRAAVTKVVFDESVENARPTSTYLWFSNFENLINFVGIQHLHTNKTTDMSHMFQNCKKLRAVDVSGFNTSNVTDMSSMFMNCESLTTLDVNSFDMSKVTNVVYMFDGCKNLVSIYCEKDWSENTTISTPHGYLFGGCTSLRGGKGTKFDPDETALSYAHPDARPENPGYFWRAGDDGINPDEPEEVDPYLTLCDVTGVGDFEDVLHSQFDDGNWDSDGQLAIVFTTSDSIYFDMNSGELITHNQSGYLYIIRINPTSLDDLRGTYTLGRSSGGRITIEDGEMTYNDRFDNGNIIISLNEDETAYTVVINMTLYYSEVTLMGVVDGLCGGSIPSTPKYKVHVSGGYGEPYDTNGHTAIVESYAIFLQRDVYFEDVADTELSINVRNIDEGWTFDHWTVNGENVGSTRPLSYTISDEEAFIVAHYRSSASYYSVMVGSEHGTVYDQNGTPLESYMGDPCFFADGPLSLNVTDIDEGWEFDYWLVDNQNVGSDLPYTFTPNHDLTVVTAIYKQSTVPTEERYVIVAKRKADANWFYMTADVGTASTKRYQAVDAGTTNLSEVVTSNLDDKYYWEIEGNELKSGDMYSYWTSGNSANLREESGFELTIVNEGDYYTFSFADGDNTRYLALNNQANNNFFAYYKGTTQIYQLHLIPVGGSSTDIEQISQEPKAKGQKLIRDGQLFIIRDGKIYNAQGARVQ